MKPIKKSVRVKPTTSQLDRKFKSDLLSKWDYIIESEKSSEFVIPPETKWNMMLTLISPIAKVDSNGRFSPDGKLGSLTTYYIPNNQFNAVKAYLEEFDIPEEFHKDLMWVFLNMVFAASEASAETKYKSAGYSDHKAWITAFGILESLADEKYILKELVLEYEVGKDISSMDGRTKSGKKMKNRFKEKNVLELFIRMIQHYKTSEPYELSKIAFDFVSEVGIERPFDGYKNVEKKWESFFSVVVYYYLSLQINNSQLDFTNVRILDTITDYDRKPGLSNSRIYLLIGKLMLLSGLMKMKERTIRDNSLDEDLIEKIEKKIQSEIKFKRANKIYRNHLLNQGIVSMNVPPFYLHFLQE